MGTVAVRVDGVHLEPTMPFPEVVTGPITFDVHTTCAQVLVWVRRLLPNWDVRPRGDELLVVRGPGWRLPLLVRATLDPSTVHTEAVGAVVLGRAVGSRGSWSGSVRSPFRRSTRHSTSSASTSTAST